ncbi:hypothetical protein [Variovorax sp. HJSM1_2]|uniref:carboxylate--amine ligase n=1 Tax=Variovorax sp. HJSM1_2 TaxID=3366263 RepID=UPI003BDABE9F
MKLFPDNSPPCIVLGLETQIGLNIVRELGRAGVKVIGMTHDPRAIGLASKYLYRSVVVSPPRSTHWISSIFAIGEEFGPCCLIAVSEVNLKWLAKHRAEFGKVKPIVPTLDTLALVLDKQHTLSMAQKLGISTPQTTEPKSIEDIENIAVNFQFPAILKWKDPNTVSPKLSAAGLPLHKVQYVYNGADFLDATRCYESIGEWPLVQSYCPGIGLGQFFYMHKGQAVRRFQHLRIAEWPPEGGFSSVCDSVPLEHHISLQEQSIALLQEAQWEGVAMVEYRWDQKKNSAVLMEINGRYWGSYPLAVQCNANFAVIAYALNSGMKLPELDLIKFEHRCRMASTEIKRLIRICFQKHLIVDRSFNSRPIAEVIRFIRDYFKKNVGYYIWDKEDPKPFWIDCKNLFRKLS